MYYSYMILLRSNVDPRNTSLSVIFTVGGKISGNFIPMLNFQKIYHPSQFPDTGAYLGGLAPIPLLWR